MADILAYIDNIFFQAKVKETARRIGVEVRMCATAEGLRAEIAKNRPRLIIVDLNARANAFEAIAIANAEAGGVPTIGFVSHVQTDVAERAWAAGCGEVMPRSKFTRDLATILGRAKSQS